jgi:tRNA1(Val) A37 N6-methylase TrmN6
MNDVAADVTEDTLLRGRVKLLQPAHGFRSSLDPVLLAAFVSPPYGRFVDIGCGSGALAFLLAAADGDATGVGVEIQPRLAALARAGAGRNGFEPRLTILLGDIRGASGRTPLAAGAFDLVISNPPYRPVTSGLVSPDAERAQANHELTLALDEWLDAAAALARPQGRVAVVFAADRLTALLGGMSARGLSPERLRAVHPRVDQPASRVLVEARKGGEKPLAVLAPLALHGLGGGYTAEVRSMLGEI